MKDKVLLIIIIIFALAIGVGIGIYFSGGDKDGDKDKGSESIYGPEAKEEGTRLEREDFSIDMPKGWAEMGAPTGVSAMVVYTSEEITDPAAQKINFRSYFSVVYDTLGEKTMEEYIQYTKDVLPQSIPDIVMTHEEKGIIDNQDAYFIEAEFNQRDIDFKILLSFIKGKEQDVWIISFSTAVSNWDSYKDLFYQIAKSFKVK